MSVDLACPSLCTQLNRREGKKKPVAETIIPVSASTILLILLFVTSVYITCSEHVLLLVRNKKICSKVCISLVGEKVLLSLNYGGKT